MSPTRNERDRDLERKRNKSSEAARIEIPDVVDPVRREKCLKDPERFLLTYGAPEEGKPVELQHGKFWMPFARHHKAIISAIYERAKTGGDKAVAATRGEGKTTVCWWMIIFVILAKLRHHPCGIGATNKKAHEELFLPIQNELTWNDLLLADFPEVCYPLRAMGGTARLATKQHVDGIKTHVKSTAEKLRLPTVKGSPYGGCTVAYYGLDAAIRGSRHDFAVINDPETRAVAFSVANAGRKAQHEVVEDLIDADVAGLAFPGSSIPRVVVTTIQNRSCYSYRVTSRNAKEGGKPSFEGDRYGILESWPTDQDLWDEYIAIRQKAQSDGDKDGWAAVEFYKTNMDAMKAGAKVSNSMRYDQSNPAELDALQSFFNKVADWGLPRVLAELQNDPEEEETENTLAISPGLVASRISGLNQNVLPSVPDTKITIGIDIGNYVSHWVKVAWFGNASGVVIDEGELVTANMVKNPEQAFLTKSLITALSGWRTNMLSVNPPDFCLIDSGSGLHQEAVYEFVRQAGGVPFMPAKGWEPGRFRMPPVNDKGQAPAGKRNFFECWAHKQPADGLWLYNVNTEFWKRWLQERFMTATFDDNQKINDGSLSLFASPDAKRWKELSEHICAEGREELFIPGKGFRSEWKVHNKRNHKLDALALACSAAGVVGVRLIQRDSLKAMQSKSATTRPVPKPSNRRFRNRPGGWVQGRRNA